MAGNGGSGAGGDVDIRRAARRIAAGGLVAYPTETFYGIAARCDAPEALARLAALKQRPADSPFPLLIEALEALEGLVPPAVFESIALHRLARRFWPGPLTLVLPAREAMHEALLGANGGVAVRVSSHPVAAELVRRVGVPITATSANLRGRPPCSSPADLAASGLEGSLDFVLRAGKTRASQPSTVLQVAGTSAVVLRAGDVPMAALASVLEELGMEVTRA